MPHKQNTYETVLRDLHWHRPHPRKVILDFKLKVLLSRHSSGSPPPHHDDFVCYRAGCARKEVFLKFARFLTLAVILIAMYIDSPHRSGLLSACRYEVALIASDGLDKVESGWKCFLRRTFLLRTSAPSDPCRFLESA